VGVPTQAFIWERGEYTLLPPPKGDLWSYAYGVNDVGIVCGSAGNPGELEACTWTGGKLEFLAPLPVKGSVAYDLNKNLAVVGQMGHYSVVGPTDALGFMWQSDSVTILAPPSGWLASKAAAVSEGTTSAGYGPFDDPESGVHSRALAWLGPNAESLGILPGYIRSFGIDINSSQEVVGYCTSNSGPDGAYIWRDGTMFNLNDQVEEGFDGQVWQAHSINESGTILASGLDFRNGGWGMLILTPQTQSPADLNHDCHTNSIDLVLLLAQWGAASASAADFNGDGVVGPADLAALLAEWTD
jgi:probable HAF family extracellular repeat protein